MYVVGSGIMVLVTNSTEVGVNEKGERADNHNPPLLFQCVGFKSNNWKCFDFITKTFQNNKLIYYAEKSSLWIYVLHWIRGRTVYQMNVSSVERL